jgi:hypothetical protein
MVYLWEISKKVQSGIKVRPLGGVESQLRVKFTRTTLSQLIAAPILDREFIHPAELAFIVSDQDAV